MFFDPPRGIFVCDTRCNEQPELVCPDTGAAQELLIHRASIDVITLPTDQRGAAFVDAAGGACEAAELVGGMTRRHLTQVPCTDLYGFQVLCHLPPRFCGRFSMTRSFRSRQGMV